MPPEDQSATPETRAESDVVEDLTALFQESAVKSHLIGTIGLFATIGIGIGLTGFVLIRGLMDQGQTVEPFIGFMLAITLVLFAMFLGPALAALIAVRNIPITNLSVKESSLVCAVSSYLGVVGMTVLIVLLSRSQLPAEGREILSLGDLLGPIFMAAFPAALVAAVAVYLDGRVNQYTDR